VNNSILELRHALECAGSTVALTGAGISAESGVPTFRGPNGLWRNYSPEKLATPEAFARDPRLVWEWYDWRRGIIRQAQPNAGHLALAELERRKPSDGPAGRSGFTLITQNVDGLHDRAGSRNLVKLHGDLWLAQCTGCGTVEPNEEVPLRGDLPPRCKCGAALRPAVVWFGESLPPEVWERGERRLRRFLGGGDFCRGLSRRRPGRSGATSGCPTRHLEPRADPSRAKGGLGAAR
jgi:NAD-dependent deacetylase